MTTGMKMFMLAAQELNFTRAAQKGFVTPQCLSDHIKRLEAEYNAVLFERRPHLALTPEGEAMYRCFSEVQTLEANMAEEIAGISAGTSGTVRLGIPPTRGRMYLPKILPAFQQQYPNVHVEIQQGDTHRLEPLLAEGELDMIMAVNANQNPMFRHFPICRETMYAVVPAALMRQKYGAEYPQKVGSFYTEGIEVQELADIPLVMSNGISSSATSVRAFLLMQGVQVKSPVIVSDFDILLEICLSGRYATICLMSNIGRLVGAGSRRRDVFAFPVKYYEDSLAVEIITRSCARHQPYHEALITLLREETLRENARVARWMAEQDPGAD